MSDAYPSRTAEKVVTRLPDGMRDRLSALAKRNGRSTNAEIVQALESWLDLAENGQKAIEALKAETPEPAGPPRVIHMLLDSKGPISWSEVHQNIGAVIEAGKITADELRVSVFTPEHVANSARAAEAAALAERYRALAENGWKEE